jgi:putative transposase
MKGATMLEKLYQLGITPSNSRPRVSNDNARAESLFHTLKYRPNYQPKGFATLDEARDWCQHFVNWYRHEHHHSALKFLTPAQRHEQPDHGHGILAKRHEVYEAAKKQHPERWNGRDTRDWSIDDVVYLNPDRQVEYTDVAVDNSSKQAS